MSTSMRLKRFGTKKRPYYRIVIQDSRSATSSSTIDEVGFYRPIDKSNQVELKVDKIKEWLGKGVVVSDTVKNILNSEGISIERNKG